MSKLKISDFWPDQKPTVSDYIYGWLTLDRHIPNREGLRKLMKLTSAKHMIELGSFYGMSAKFLMENSADSKMMLFCVDYWDNEWIYSQFKKFLDDTPLGNGLNNNPLHSTFLSNLWEYRQRVVPLKMSTLDGLRKIKQFNLPIDLIYIDATHDYPSVKAEIELILELFPEAVICGDDYDWGGVKVAVDEMAKKHEFQLIVDGPFWVYQPE